MTSEEFPSDGYFVDLELNPLSHQTSAKTVKNVKIEKCSDLLRLQDNEGHVLSHVLVSGQMGMGKTALISRLAYQWAINKRKPISEETRILHKFEFVFVVDLRRCEPDMCLVDAVGSQLPTNVSKQQLEEFLTNHASECLYLFDGYNEMSGNDKILKSNLLCGSHVIVTTRPNKVESFHDNHKKYVQVILEGFSETSITRFVKAYFANSEDTSDRLLKIIFDNSVAKIVARVPLILSMICCVWKKSRNTSPEAISELYHHAKDQLEQQTKPREPQHAPMSTEKLQIHLDFDQIMVHIVTTSQKAAKFALTYLADAYKIETPKNPSTDGVLRQICRLTLLLLFEAESKFGVVYQLHNIVSSSLVNMTIYVVDDPVYRAALTYFILRFDTQKVWTECLQTAIEYMHCGYIEENSSYRCKCEKHLEILGNMPHLKKLTIEHVSFSEKCRIPRLNYFKFRYIKGLPHSLEELTLRNFEHRIDQACEFVDGLSHGVQLHLDYLGQDVNDWSVSDTEKLSNLLQFVHSRGGSIRKIKMVGSIYKEQSNDDYNMKQVIKRVVPFCSKLKAIKLFGMKLTKECVDILCDGITQAGHKLSSHDPAYDEHEEGACKVSDQSNVCLPLQEFDLARNKIAPSIHKVCGLFPLLGCLKALHLSYCDLTEKDFLILGPALSYLPNLQRFNVMGNNIDNSLNALIEGINHSKISSICLGVTKMTKESKKHLSELRLPFLEYINLRASDMDASDAEALAVSIEHMPQLSRIDLECNSVGSDGAKALLESFQSTQHREVCNVHLGYNKITSIALEPSQSLSLTYLGLCSNKINCEGAVALASSFRYMPRLKSLDISENPIGPQGLEAIFRKLHHLSKLNLLSHPRFPMPRFPREKESSKMTKLTGKLKAVFQHRREGPPSNPPTPPPSAPQQTLIQACIEGMKEKGIWRDTFYCFGIQMGALHAEHIQEIVRVAATFPSES